MNFPQLARFTDAALRSRAKRALRLRLGQASATLRESSQGEFRRNSRESRSSASVWRLGRASAGAACCAPTASCYGKERPGRLVAHARAPLRRRDTAIHGWAAIATRQENKRCGDGRRTRRIQDRVKREILIAWRKGIVVVPAESGQATVQFLSLPDLLHACGDSGSATKRFTAKGSTDPTNSKPVTNRPRPCSSQ